MGRFSTTKSPTPRVPKSRSEWESSNTQLPSTTAVSSDDTVTDAEPEAPPSFETLWAKYNEMLSIDDIYAFKEVFNEYDRDQSGTISRDELVGILNDLGSSTEEDDIDKMMASVDFDGSGKIDFKEFCLAMAQQADENSQLDSLEVEVAFRLFDRDSSGRVDKIELREVFLYLGENLTEAEFSEMWRLADRNISGDLDYEEFKRIMNVG